LTFDKVHMDFYQTLKFTIMLKETLILIEPAH